MHGTSRCVLLGLLVLLLAACGGPARRELRVLTQFPVASADPQALDDSTTLAMLANVLEPLVRFDAEGRLLPALAVSWSTPDDRTWRFELRRHVRFHDGRPFAAEDARATLERMLARTDWVRSTVPLLERVSAPEEFVLELRTSAPSTLLVNQLASVLIVPRQGPAAPPVGTGPYRATVWAPSELRLAAFDGYWGGPPHWARAYVWPEPDGHSRLAAVRERRADVAEAPLAEDLRLLGGDGPARLVRHRSPRLVMLGLGAGKGRPFADPALRAALAASLDREAIIRESYGGLAQPATQLAPPGVFGYVPEPGVTAGSVARPARPVAAAGRVAVPLVFAGERNGAVARMVARQAGGAGIALEPRAMPVDELDSLLRAGQAEAFVIVLTFPQRDASDFLSWAFHAPSPDGRWGSLNFTRYQDAAADALIESAEREFNPRRRYQLLQAAMQAAVSSRAWIPICVPESLHAVRRGLRWERSASGRVRLDEIEPAP